MVFCTEVATRLSNVLDPLFCLQAVGGATASKLIDTKRKSLRLPPVHPLAILPLLPSTHSPPFLIYRGTPYKQWSKNAPWKSKGEVFCSLFYEIKGGS